MRSSLAFLMWGAWASSAFAFFRRFGALGVFLLGICDSSFLFFPFGNDLLLIALVSAQRDSLVWILYVVAAAAGSVVGVLLVDAIMRKAGEKGLEHFVKPRKIERLRKKLEDRAGRMIFLSTLIPPPFPFTAVVMTASALQTPRKTVLLSVFFGRLLRFTIEALLALYFGQRLLAYLDSDVVEYAVYLIAAVAIVGSVLSIRKWLKGRSGWSGAAGPRTSEG